MSDLNPLFPPGERQPGLALSPKEGKDMAEEDLELVMDAIRLIVNSGKGYGEIVLTFRAGKLEDVRPTPFLKPNRSE